MINTAHKYAVFEYNGNVEDKYYVGKRFISGNDKPGETYPAQNKMFIVATADTTEELQQHLDHSPAGPCSLRSAPCAFDSPMKKSMTQREYHQNLLRCPPTPAMLELAKHATQMLHNKLKPCPRCQSVAAPSEPTAPAS